MKLKLHNYQIHSDSELEINGLVGIVGSNNNGKTAIIRSIRDFVLNTFGEEKIRQGKDKGYIDIDGTRLIRNAKTSILQLPDGKKLEKMAGQKIAKLVQLKDFLYIDNTKISNLLPQFVFQRETPFPFNLSDAQVYYVFSMLFDIEKLNKLFIYTKEKIKKNTTDITYNKGKLDENLKMILNFEDKKSKLPPIDRIKRLEFLLQSYKLVLSHATNLQNDKIKQEKIVKLQELTIVKQYLIMIQMQKKLEKFQFDESIVVNLKLLEKHFKLKKTEEQYLKSQNQLDDLEKQLGEFKVCPLCGK